MAERIVSLLPSATEILFFLGLGDRVVGVTYECNEPGEASQLPHVTDTIIPPGATPGEIDHIINQAVAEGRELYRLDRTLLSSLDPDLIVSQDLCRVCALPSGDVDAAVADLGCRAEVFSYDPMTLLGVLDEIERLAEAAAAGATAAKPLGSRAEVDGAGGPRSGSTTEVDGAGGASGRLGELRQRLDLVAERVAGRPRPRVLLLEWVDPPFSAGHWIPDQIVAAGGEPVLAHPGGRSAAMPWSDVADCRAEVLLVAPCGFDEAGARRQLDEVVARPELGSLPAVAAGRTHAIDADAYVVRPGPRLVDGVERMAALFHPDLFPA